MSYIFAFPPFLYWSSCILDAILTSVLIGINNLFASNPRFETPTDEVKHAKDSSSLILSSYPIICDVEKFLVGSWMSIEIS